MTLFRDGMPTLVRHYSSPFKQFSFCRGIHNIAFAKSSLVQAIGLVEKHFVNLWPPVGSLTRAEDDTHMPALA